MKVLKLKTTAKQLLKFHLFLLVIPFLLLSIYFLNTNPSQQSVIFCSNQDKCSVSNMKLTNGCGAGNGFVQTSINFGCYGNGCKSSTANETGYCGSDHNGITDLIFAIIRFLSDGVGLVIIASIIVGGIQFISSRGDPGATQAAIKRLTSSVTALVIFIFAYAILNYVIPNGFLK